MENFFLYEELGRGNGSVVYKGRRAGSFNFVAVMCTDKAKRLELTNHVRLSRDLDHSNIVCFYEWYETSNHLWSVAELCTGGSLKYWIDQDRYLNEDAVRKFGWDLVKGLKHIHESGIIFSDLTPAKILLDGSFTLKFGNFCLSKLVGETLEDVLTSLSTAEEAGEEDRKENFDNMRKRLQGSPTYRAPEVLQGSETSKSSDLWALGCILFYMYTGKPPFSSDSCTELTDMIMNQEPPPPRQTVFSVSPPSEEFQSLLNALLNKNPENRMDWPELLKHAFWIPVRKSNLHRQAWIPDPLTSAQVDERPNSQSAITQPAHSTCQKPISSQTTPAATDRTDDQQVVRHTTCGALRNSQGLNRKMGKESREDGQAKSQDDPKLASRDATNCSPISR